MSAYAGRKVLITGAGGFIGSHLWSRLVEEGAQVGVLLRYSSLPPHQRFPQKLLERTQVHRGDITDRDLLDRAMDGAEVVFHLAALVGIP